MMFPKKLQSALILALHVFSVQAVIGVEANKPSERVQLCQRDIYESFTKLAETELGKIPDKESEYYKNLEKEKDEITQGICYGLGIFYSKHTLVGESQENFYSFLSLMKQYGENKICLGEDNYNKAVKILKAQIDNSENEGYKHIMIDEVSTLFMGEQIFDCNMMRSVIGKLVKLPQDFACLLGTAETLYKKEGKKDVGGHAVVFVKREQDLFFYDPNFRNTINSNVADCDNFVHEVVDQIRESNKSNEWFGTLRLFQKASTSYENNRDTMLDTCYQLSNQLAQDRHREGLANLKNWLSLVSEYGSNSYAETTKDKELKFNCMPDEKIVKKFHRAMNFLYWDFQKELKQLVRDICNAEKNTFLRVLLAEEAIKQIDSFIVLLSKIECDTEMQKKSYRQDIMPQEKYLKLAQQVYRQEQAAAVKKVTEHAPMLEQLNKDQVDQRKLICKDWTEEGRKRYLSDLKLTICKKGFENRIEEDYTAHEVAESPGRFLLNYLVAQSRVKKGMSCNHCGLRPEAEDSCSTRKVLESLSQEYERRCREKIAEQRKRKKDDCEETYDKYWVRDRFYNFIAKNTDKHFREEIKKEKAYWLDVLLDLFGS